MIKNEGITSAPKAKWEAPALAELDMDLVDVSRPSDRAYRRRDGLIPGGTTSMS